MAKSFSKGLIYIICHTHWDYEWFLPACYINQWLKPLFKDLLFLLKKHPDYCFVLDGQTLIIENYLSLLSKREARLKEKEIEKFVQQGRLKIGPYYMAPDYSIPGGETLVRNLLVGHRIATRFGGVMKAGWLLDPFGLPAQIPQIHQGFGIDSVFLWRGVPIEPGRLKTEWWWHAPDGSKVLVVYLIDSYRNVMGLSTYPELARDRIIAEAEKLACFSSFRPPIVLLMDGYDLDPTPDDIAEMVGTLDKQLGGQVKLALITPEEYLRTVKREIRSQRRGLLSFSGFLYSGQYNAVFPGVLSTRMYLKQKNHEIEKLLFWTEFISSLSLICGGLYPNKILWQSWKTFLKNQPHDSICGVSVDEVHKGMMERYHKVEKDLKEVAQKQFSSLVSVIDTSSRDNSDEVLIVFNPLPWSRRELVKVWLDQSVFKKKNLRLEDSQGKPLDFQVGEKREGKKAFYFSAEIPPFGYQSFFLGSALANSRKSVKGVVAFEKTKIMENEHLKVKINNNGSVNVLDKKTRKYYQNLGYLEDRGDAGDEYNYSPPKKDKVITSLNKEAKIELLDQGPFFCRFKVEFELDLPISLSPNRVTRSRKTQACPVVCYLSLAKDSPLVSFELAVNNTVKDHRLRVCFPSRIETDFSLAQVQFGTACHPIDPGQVDFSQIPEKVRRTLLGQRETTPITWHPQQGFVDLNDGQAGLAIIAPGIISFEVLKKEKVIALTLLRCVGWLARSDLLTRKGDAGPAILTPGAQCLGRHTFSYCIFPHQGNWLEAGVYQKAEEQRFPLESILTSPSPGELPKKFSFFKLKSEPPTRLIITAVKKSEEGDDLIMRLYNIGAEKVKAGLRARHVKACHLTNLVERTKRKLKRGKNGDFSFLVKGHQIATLRIKVEKKGFLKEKKRPKFISLLDLFSSTKNVSFPSPPPAVSLVDIQEEKARIEKIKLELVEAKKRLAKLKGKTAKSHLILEKAKNRVYTLERTLLEAQLSLLLIEKEWVEQRESLIVEEKIGKIKKELKKIGDKLNSLRVKRRLSDFLVAYWDYRTKKVGRLKRAS